MATIANLDDDPTRDALALFDDDDDPFNLPPPLPPLSPHGEDDGTNQDGGAQGDQEAGEGDKKETKKRKVNRSPRPKLDEVRLCGNRGIPALSHLCDDIKFKGKGHEASDLKLLLQRYEHWAHRLFPKFPFADVVDQVENLGSKKLVQNCIKRIRRGEDDEVDDGDRSDTELAQNGETQDDDGVLSQVPMTPGINNNQAFGVQVEATDRVVILTPEQQERIRLNRERALAKRKAVLERQAQQNNSQTDDQTTPAEETTPSTGDVEVAKEDDDTTRNPNDTENDSSVQANDIEMEDDMMDKKAEDNGQESLVNDSETNVEKTGFASMALEKENVDHEDVEMENAETAALDSADIVQEESNVPEEDNANTNETTEDNDLLESAKGLATNEDNLDEATVSQVEETRSLSLDDESLHEEGPKETSDARSKKQAPHENGPDEAQNAEMETEQS